MGDGSSVYIGEDGVNIMISYSHQDHDFMLRVRDLLADNGFDVWVDTKLKGGSNFFSDIGSAVIGCNLLVFILSEHSVASKFCQDELSLARISNKKILPITASKLDEVFPKMDAGLKLILSCVQWAILDENLGEDENNSTILKTISETLEIDMNDTNRIEYYDIAYSQDARPLSRHHGYRRSKSLHTLGFWDRNFGSDIKKVDLTEILGMLKDNYKFDYAQLSFADNWALKALTLWCFDLERNMQQITREQYDTFVFPEGRKPGTKEGPDMFWLRVKDGFSVRLSMEEVFDVKSSVRYDSIKNLKKIKSKRVLTALYKLLKDSDPNIRAVACVSLVQTDLTNLTSLEKITKLLTDSDRLVRESACLALAKFNNKTSVPRLLDVWRNDVISDVRGAAKQALESIGTEEAREGMKVVQTLQEEFKNLYNI